MRRSISRISSTYWLSDRRSDGPRSLAQARQLADERIENAAPLYEPRGAQLGRAAAAEQTLRTRPAG
jgi:hypothetical protein